MPSPPETISLGSGRRVPYPIASSPAASNVARANRRANTSPEVQLRSELHRRGLRFRKDFLVRMGGTWTRPDIAFTRARVAVFVDGCFWHSCPEHGTVPRTNVEYWVPKLQANVARDRRNTAFLHDEGWAVVRLWEHEDPVGAAERIDCLVKLHRRRTIARAADTRAKRRRPQRVLSKPR